MTIYRIEIEYSAGNQIEKLTSEEYQDLKKLVIGLPEEQKYIWGKLLVDDEGLNALLKVCPDGGISLRNFKNTYSNLNDHHPLKCVEEAKGLTHIHIPNLGLLTINNVKV